jgi:hypothetical protein
VRVGLGFRAELAADLVARPRTVDFVEVVAESCYTQGSARREAIALAERWPVIPHGVKLSLGTAAGVDLDRARRLGTLARQLHAPLVSEHVAFTRADGVEIGHLTQLPRTREAVRVIAANVTRVRRVLPDVPLLLENVAWSLLWPDDEMDEPSFYHEVVAATGCGLLLDVGNLYANAVNEGLDPVAVLAAYPLDRVGMIHVAGGVWEDGFYFDTHAHAIPAPVLDLVGRVVAMHDVPVMIERDADIAFDGLARELDAIRALPTRADAAVRAEPVVQPSDAADRASDAMVRGSISLAAAQGELARLLAGPPMASPWIDRLGAGPVGRARAILQRKRVDDALPLLANLGRASALRDVAIAALDGRPRPVRAAGPADAWHIAGASLAIPGLADLAAVDRLLLRARFAGLTGEVRPRRTPFVGFARLANGTRIRATKGLGALAAVTIHEPRR